MREFFRGWRRKVGCVALVLACGFATGWMRSYEYDWFEISGVRISSCNGSFGPSRIAETKQGPWVIPKHEIVVPIPYWAPTISLTLLSAYLILWKPRQRMGSDHA